jgi:hypothetical protein
MEMQKFMWGAAPFGNGNLRSAHPEKGLQDFDRSSGRYCVGSRSSLSGSTAPSSRWFLWRIHPAFLHRKLDTADILFHVIPVESCCLSIGGTAKCPCQHRKYRPGKANSQIHGEKCMKRTVHTCLG